MKNIIAILCMVIGAVIPAAASAYLTPAPAQYDATKINAQASNLAVERSENILFVKADIDISAVHRGTNRELWIEPVVVGGSDQEYQLPVVVMAGRNRFFQAQRHDTPVKENFTLVRDNYKDPVYTYTASVPYESWMHGAELKLILELRGCCSDSIDRQEILLTNVNVEPPVEKFIPAFNWITPQAETVKTRELKGQAYIDFPVNKTVIYPDYRRNTIELAKIRATIDSVHQDPDITITALSIRGYASPEGPWNNNVRLAKGRTAALKDYVEQLYHFKPGFITTSYDPEDWGGLRTYVENSSITNREGILSIIDSSLEPDAKDAKLKSTYPQQYAFLLREVYPGLRHSDYTVEFTIRQYTDIEEIKELLRTNPGKLSLNEMFVGASAMTPGTPEYNHAFEVAVLLYPDSEDANLNAANVAMQEKNFTKAEQYLKKAGSSTAAIYARGILEGLKGDYALAEQTLKPIADVMPEAADALAKIQEITNLSR